MTKAQVDVKSINDCFLCSAETALKKCNTQIQTLSYAQHKRSTKPRRGWKLRHKSTEVVNNSVPGSTGEM